MSTDTPAATDQQKRPVSATSPAVVFGYSVAFSMYAVIFAVALVTLSLVLIRQSNMVNFNALIATLEQRDRVNKELPQIVTRIGTKREEYDQALVKKPRDCFDVSGPIMSDEPAGHERAIAISFQPVAGTTPQKQARSCDELLNTIRDKANELWFTEMKAKLTLAHIDTYYMNYIDGITQKTPQIIPALQFLDSGNRWVNAWARSSFELMEMFLLVSMGVLGGIISVTRWVVDASPRSSKLLVYFYKPAAGGAIALGTFVVFKASQLILVGQVQDSATAMAPSIFLLAAIGLASGFCADKALKGIEKIADHLFRVKNPSRMAAVH